MTVEITPQSVLRQLDALTVLVARAAAATLAIPVASIERRTKPDRSPVTAADEAAEAIILDGAARLLPGVPVIAEESVDLSAPVALEPSFLLVDPLDGTKEFLAGLDEFTVNLAVITRGVAIAGIIAAPKQGLLWRGVIGGKAERLHMRFAANEAPVEASEAMRTRRAPAQLVAAVSRSHLERNTEEFLTRLSIAARVACGSSLKFCRLAQGDIDVYPRLAPTREWDIAAGCAIVAAAGGTVTGLRGEPLQFGHREKGFLVPGFIAWGDPARAVTAA